jgi:hypothetical protein
MTHPSLLARVTGTVFTGLVGAAAYDGLQRVRRQVPARSAAVSTTVVALRALRRAERGAEGARLAAADVVAEARERLGEQAPVPATSTTHGHDHDH